MPNFNYRKIVLIIVSTIVLVGLLAYVINKTALFNFNKNVYEKQMRLSDEEDKELRFEPSGEYYTYMYNTLGGFRLTFPNEFSINGRSKEFIIKYNKTFADVEEESATLSFKMKYLNPNEKLFTRVQDEFVEIQSALGKDMIRYEQIQPAKYGETTGYYFICNEESRRECLYLKIDDSRYLFVTKDVKAENTALLDIALKTLLESFKYYRQ